MKKEDAIEFILRKIQNENDGEHMDFVLPGYIAKRLIAYQSIREDLLLVSNATKLLINEKHNHVITTSLYHTILVLYGKCFTDASSSKSPKLELKDCFDEEKDKALAELHKELMNLRHNFVAHRGSTEHEIGFGYFRVKIDDLSRHVNVKQLKRRLPSKDELKDYIQLFNHLVKVVEGKFEKEAGKVMKHMLSEYTGEELAQFKIAGPTVQDEANKK